MSETALAPFSEAKSIYASSTTIIPLNGSYSSNARMDEIEMRVPVGFPGEQRNISFRDGPWASIALLI